MIKFILRSNPDSISNSTFIHIFYIRLLTSPLRYQRYFKFGQELPCVDLGQHGLFCEQLVIEFEDAALADGSDSMSLSGSSSSSNNSNRELRGIGGAELPPPLSLPLPDAAVGNEEEEEEDDDDDDDDDVGVNNYVPPAADLSDGYDNTASPSSPSSSSSFQRQPGRPRRFVE